MAVVTPSVTAKTSAQFKLQIGRVAGFANRLHIDVADGDFAPATVPIEQCWWPVNVTADLHVMYQQPWRYWESIIAAEPRLIIVHAEADLEDFVARATQLHTMGFAIGLAFLQATAIKAVPKQYFKHIDHVLIFSGDLGHFGGTADLSLLDKVSAIHKLAPQIEIGWDGGVNEANIAEIASHGVDVITAGGFIQKASDPLQAYLELAHRCV